MHPLLMTMARRRPTVCSLSGSLSATGSTPSIVGTTRTWTVPAGPPANSGTIRFNDVSTDGAGAVQYSKNGGAFTTVTSGTEVVFADTDTIQMRTTSLDVGNSGTATLYDVDAATNIGTYTWARTS